jgi:2-keto-4-pentenoate hydratase/2-oxohepta-3-ene-1,7-dioic acid hydratase in catechol pathway
MRLLQPDQTQITAIWSPALNSYVDLSPWGHPSPDQELLATPLNQRTALLAELATLAESGVPVNVETCTLLPSVQLPSKLVCLGKSYGAHAREFDGDSPSEPSIFLKAPSAICSANAPVLRPQGCQMLDYEIELAVLIGSPLKRASVSEASQSIIGYTLMCDYSERDWQLHHGGQWTKGKSYDSFAPLGPCLITQDEAPDINNLPLHLSVNGIIRQNGNTSDLIMPVANLVAYVSQFMTLQPGDVISTGTPSGVAMGMEHPQYLLPGDQVRWGSDLFGFNTQIVKEDQ